MAEPSQEIEMTTVSWSSMSFDMKAFFVFHVSMMVMLFAGGGLAFVDKALIAGALALSLAAVSAVQRLIRGWRWRGASAGRWWMAVLNALMIGYLIGAGTQFSISKFQALAPWTFAGVGIGVFTVLNRLRIVHRTEAGFRASCGDGVPSALDEERVREPAWKRVIGAAFFMFVMFVWLEAVTALWVPASIFSAGSPVPTAEQSVPMTEKGRTVYVSSDDKHLSNLLFDGALLGVPLVIAIGAFLQFVLKVRLDPEETD